MFAGDDRPASAGPRERLGARVEAGEGDEEEEQQEEGDGRRV